MTWLKMPAMVIVAATLVAGCGMDAKVVNQSDQVTDLDTAGGADSLLDIAERFAADGNHAAAIPLYRQAVKNNPFAAAPLVGLGESLIAVGRHSDAEEILRKAIADEEDNPRALKALGNAYLALGQPRLALANFNQAITVGGRQPLAVSGAGIALDLMGRHDQALDAHRDAAAATNNPDVQSNHALSLALHGQAEEAAAILEGLLDSGTMTAAHRQNLALAYVMAGDEHKAMKMASVDLDAESARDTLAYFARLKGMSPAERMRVLVIAGQNPDWSLEDDANLRLAGDDERKTAAAGRVIREPEPEPEPTPEPAPEPEPEAKPEPEPEPESVPDVPPLMEPEGWAVQIGAYRSLDELVRGWEILSERYADIIGDLEPRRSEVDFGERGSEPEGFFYRLNAGPLRNFAEAAEICEALKARNAPCWIRPPEPAEGRLPAETDSNGES